MDSHIPIRIFAYGIYGICAYIAYLNNRKYNHIFLSSIFTFMVVVYHGFSDFINLLFPDFAFYRINYYSDLSEDYAASYGLTIAIGLLFFSIYSIFSLPFLVHQKQNYWVDNYLSIKFRFSKLLIVLSYFLFIVSYSFKTGETNNNIFLDILVSFSVFFFLLMNVFIIQKYISPKLIVPTVIIIILFLLPQASRFNLISSIITLTILLLKGPKKIYISRNIPIFVPLLVLSSIVITQIRQIIGRDIFIESTKLSERLNAISNAEYYYASQTGNDLIESTKTDFVYRLDANASGILAEYTFAFEPLGIGPTLTALQLTIPSFFWEQKASLSLNEETAIKVLLNRYDDIDLTVGVLGSILLQSGFLFFWLIMIFLSIILLKIDSILFSLNSPLKFLIYVSLLKILFFYESNLTGIFLGLRTTIICILIIYFFLKISINRNPAKHMII